MFNRILVPLDGSPLAERSLSYAINLAHQNDAHIHLGYVIQPPPPSVGIEPYLIPMDFSRDTQNQWAVDYLSRISTELEQKNIQCTYQVSEDLSISSGIIKIATLINADLIIKTSYGRLGINRWFNGNVAAEILQNAPCPLLLIKISDSDRIDDQDNEGE